MRNDRGESVASQLDQVAFGVAMGMATAPYVFALRVLYQRLNTAL